MTLELFGLLASVAVPVIGAILAVGKLVQMVRDHERRLTRLEALEDAEDAQRGRYRGDE